MTFVRLTREIRHKFITEVINRAVKLNVHTYRINKTNLSIRCGDTEEPAYGDDIVFSTDKTDITYNQSWYNQGYSTFKCFSEAEFSLIKNDIKQAIELILSDIGVGLSGFNLENYHHFVDDRLHLEVVKKTRDLFPSDFGFDTRKILKTFSTFLGFELNDINPKNNEQLHIIVRLNRPHSNDFNPAHKDVYEDVDHNCYFPKFMNFWIPICGVDDNSSLPIVPGSHLLNENVIRRYPAGSTVDGLKYRVCNILSWDDSVSLTRAVVDYGSALVFSGHLIHGLAKNLNEGKTRVALEFRLFKAE